MAGPTRPCRTGRLHFRALAAFYGMVERWPAALPINTVDLLPTGGMRAPLDRRPIVLLPVVYRVWASVRAAAMRDWLRQAGVLRWGFASAAEEQAAELGLALDAAFAAGEQLASPWTGSNATITCPLCYWNESPCRQGCLRPSGAPCCTPMAPCVSPMSMAWQASPACRCAAWLRAARPPLIGSRSSCTACAGPLPLARQLRDYVDDVVITAVGEGCVDAVGCAWEAAVQFSDGAGLVLHAAGVHPETGSAKMDCCCCAVGDFSRALACPLCVFGTLATGGRPGSSTQRLLPKNSSDAIHALSYVEQNIDARARHGLFERTRAPRRHRSARSTSCRWT